jgi:hypothetical protein
MKKTLKKMGRARPFVVHPQTASRILNELLQQSGISTPMHPRLKPGGIEVDPRTFKTVWEAQTAYLHMEMLSKLDDGNKSPAKEALTWERFYQAEEQCRLSNQRLKDSSYYSTSKEAPRSILERARQIMSKIVGEFSWDLAAHGFGWGPGASFSLPRRQSAPAYKYSGRPETTIGNAVLANACIMHKPRWEACLNYEEGSGYCNIVPGNRIVTVPKNWKTDRTIAIEPRMNMYVQKGIGSLLRRRLKRCGIDLNDQTKNQRLARIGSFAGTLATIDMSMASDTVSYEIVRLLMPSDWFEALEQCRCHVGVLPDGKRISYQKFSSMGNGYTFELETAIFAAIALAVIELVGGKDHRFAVYGDDVIVPSAVAPKLIEVLQFAGFTTNEKKTFVSGPFRESCGSHFYSGFDVTPFYVKKVPTSLRDLFLLHNQIYRWFMRAQANGWFDSLDAGLLHRVRNNVPSKWRRPRLPDGYGDGAFIGNFDECCPSSVRPALYGWEGFTVKVLGDVSQELDICIEGRLLAALDNVRGSFVSFTDIGSGLGSGISLPPRTRELTIHVRQYPQMLIINQ